jgi:F0F1-type ATP synthase alpha subunit
MTLLQNIEQSHLTMLSSIFSNVTKDMEDKSMTGTSTCMNVQIVLNLLGQIMNLQGKEIHNKNKETYLGQRSRRPRLRCRPGLNHPWTRRSGRAGLQEIGIVVELNGEC